MNAGRRRVLNFVGYGGGERLALESTEERAHPLRSHNA
jgi:hypothetical protein